MKYCFNLAPDVVVLVVLQWAPSLLAAIPFRERFQDLRYFLASIASIVLSGIHSRLKDYGWASSSCHRTLLDNTPYSQRIKAAWDIVETIPLDRGDQQAARPVPLKIVLLGSPGAGKSSLIHALAQIPIHRCPGDLEPEISTRCPVIVQVRRSTRAVNYEVGIHPQHMNIARSLGRVEDKQDLPGIIRRAQTLVLNPPRPGTIRVSDDAVRVHVYGAATDVTIIELPGIDEV